MVKIICRSGLRSIVWFPYSHHQRKVFHFVIKDHTNRLSYLVDPTGSELYRANVFPATGISLNPERKKDTKEALAIKVYDLQSFENFPKFPVLLRLNLEAAVPFGQFFRH